MRQSWLGQYFGRMRGKLGAPKTIIAAAHKLARIIFHMLTAGQAYDDETIFAQQEAQNHQRIQQRLRQQAKQYGFQLVESAAQ